MPRVLQQAFHLQYVLVVRVRYLVDLPFDVQVAEIEFDPDMYEPLPVYKPAASRMQIEKAVEMLLQAERPVIVAGGGVINADAAALLQQFAELTSVPVIPTLIGWGCIPDDHELMAGWWVCKPRIVTVTQRCCRIRHGVWYSVTRLLTVIPVR